MSGLSVVIPALNAGRTLAATLRALDGGGGDIIGEIIVVDGGSADDTAAVARNAGATVIAAPCGRGGQSAAGGAAAAGTWLLFLHADTVLGQGWREETRRFILDPGNAERAAAFRFALDDDSPAARRLERAVNRRSRLLGLPYGDQGLLLSRRFYLTLGGYRPLPLMEDVDLVRRIGAKRMVALETPALTSAARWRRDGWILRSARNLACLGLYFAGVPPRLIRKLYG